MRDSIEKLAGKGVRSVEGLRITSSFGVSILTSKNQSLPDLIELADQALYTSKDSGRNKVSVYRETEERKMDKAHL
jgi:PleD family two-component response regulator